MRDRRGPLAAMLLLAGYAAAILWAELALAHALGAPHAFRPAPLLKGLLGINFVLLLWRIVMRAAFTAAAYGPAEGLRAIPRLLVANLIAIRAAWRAVAIHRRGGPLHWDKTAHIFPAEIAS